MSWSLGWMSLLASASTVGPSPLRWQLSNGSFVVDGGSSNEQLMYSERSHERGAQFFGLNFSRPCDKWPKSLGHI